MFVRRLLGTALIAALTACSGAGGGMIPSTPAASTLTASSSGRTALSDTASPGGGALALPGGGALALPGGGALALPGGGALALPGGGALALPGGGALALPGGGALALPGGGALALPGGGALALPGGGIATLLGVLTNIVPICSVTAIVVGRAQCNALLNTSVAVIPNAGLTAAAIPGIHPSDLQSAYQFSGTGAGATVAVVVAGDAPTAESDLAVYRTAFGLGPCTSANGCFRKVNQSGSESNLPAALSGWPQEAGIDVQMVSAVCARCSILLVEANSPQISDLGASVDTAVALGAKAVNNSYYAPEYSSELQDNSHYLHPGVAISVSSGDTGYGPTFPASSAYVTAVGGTSLSHGLTGWSQTVWGATGSGCSAYVAKPSWQHDSGCANRTTADVAVVGDPDTGVAVYNTTAPSGQVGWGVYGGTSVGAPIVAAMYALAGNASSTPYGAALPYAHASSFAPITTGKNGTCSPAYLCTGGPGYSGPGGLGAPISLAGF